jgi:hypothetical protein|tara:strand:+ start:6241 stop:6873 length:633 start_codon:yes stop_codon:yes gene_type:complete
MKKYFIYLIIIIIISSVFYPYIYSQKQRKLIELLDTYDLDTKWLPGYNVDCNTGDIMPPKSTWVKSSHCSCFTSRVCNDMNIKLIGTKEGFNQKGLATNQLKWLKTEDAQKNGWEKINETVPTAYVSANKEANKGNIVIAGVEDDANLLGHVSIVRPSNRSDYLIKRDGPDTIASSKINARSVFLKEDFMFNRKELEPFENKLQFFVNRN